LCVPFFPSDDDDSDDDEEYGSLRTRVQSLTASENGG